MGMKGEGGYFLEYLDKKGAPSKELSKFQKQRGCVLIVCPWICWMCFYNFPFSLSIT